MWECNTDREKYFYERSKSPNHFYLGCPDVFFLFFCFAQVCLSEYACMCMSLSTNPVYVTVIKCLAYFWCICTNWACVFICGGFHPHIAYLVYLQLELFVIYLCHNSVLYQFPCTCSIYKEGTKYSGLGRPNV